MLIYFYFYQNCKYMVENFTKRKVSDVSDNKLGTSWVIVRY